MKTILDLMSEKKIQVLNAEIKDLDIKWYVTVLKVSKLKLWERNPKIITKEEYKRLKQKIKSQGFHDILKIDTDFTILSGNQRKRVLEELSIERIFVMFPERKLTDEERDRVALSSNISEGDWDWDKLANDFNESLLLDVGFDSIHGFDDSYTTEDTAEEDDFSYDEGAIKTSIQVGELFQLGEHQLLCGDSTKPNVVKGLMGGQRADMVFTDPPFNVGYEYNEYKDDKSPDEYLKFCGEFYDRINENIRGGGAIYIMSGNRYIVELSQLFKDKFRFSQMLLWVKDGPTLGHSDYQFNYEAILYGWNKDDTHKFYGENVVPAANIVERETGQEKTIHRAQRPVRLVSDYIKNSSQRGEVVLDLFGGSGTTLIAAQQLARKCLMIEIDPMYVELICQRWEKLTGKKRKSITKSG